MKIRIGDVIKLKGSDNSYTLIVGLFDEEYQVLHLETLEVDQITEEQMKEHWELTDKCLSGFLYTIDLLRNELDMKPKTKKVEFTYKKVIKFETEIDQAELDKIVLNEEIPDWIDKMMDDIDNEQPAELVGFRVVKEK